MVIHKIKFIVISFLILLFTGCSAFLSQQKQPEFVKVKDGKFYRAEKPYYFLGTNLWYGGYIASKGSTGDRERLIKELDFLKSINVTNLRILAASEQSPIENAVTPAMQSKPGEYNEELLDGLDFLLSEMGKRNMVGVLFLNNYWEWSGGMSQYNAWTSGGEMIDPTRTGRWHEFMQRSADFYTNVEGNKYYKLYIEKLINRINNYTGIVYKNDPTIMAWQLANEPRPGNSNDAKDVIQNYYRWVDETASFIKAIDINHLVTTGNEGLAGSLQSEEIYLTAHANKNIDYITFHLWPKNWGWFNAKKIEETFPSTLTKAIDYLNKHIEYARKLNKPITLEEFGLGRDFETIEQGTPVTARDKFYATIFELIYDSAAVGAPFAGSNFWGWGGIARAKNPDGKWHEGDPFMGDPPQEPQGLNSILNADSSTIDIISRFAKKMNELNDEKRKLTTSDK